jgi:ribonuclease HII
LPFLIGTDEAGYAPNLGPLVVSATLWEVAPEIADDRLFKPLRKVVCESSSKATARRVAWADSKALYTAGKGLATLERGMLAALRLIDQRPTDWHSLWRILDEESAARLATCPLHDGYTAKLPLEANGDDLDGLVPQLSAGMTAAGVHLLAIRSRAVFPAQFNDLCDHHGNKAEMLSCITLELIERLMKQIGSQPVRIICDKHGGRNRYGPLLQQRFSEWLVEVHEEGMMESRYAWGPADSRVEIRFRCGGEEFLPVALASMASKYLREAAMLALNHFWLQRVPDLRPTAGYPLDAKRFKGDIYAAQQQLGITDRVLWRER